MFNKFRRIFVGAGALAASFALCGTASATPDILQSAFGNGGTEGIAPVSDSEMQGMRGGYRTLAFGLYFTGDISSLPGDQASQLPEGVSISEQTANNVSLAIGLSSAAGSSGIVQFTEVFGNNNVINNSMTLNVVIMDGGVADPAAFLASMPLGD